MLEFSNVKVYDLRECVIASGNSMRLEPVDYTDDEFRKGLQRCKKLMKFSGGSGETNFRTGIRVSFDMKYTQYITKQFQRYHWFDYVNSSSLMHRITKMDFSKCTNGYVNNGQIEFMIRLVQLYNMLSAAVENNRFYENFELPYKKFVAANFSTPCERTGRTELMYDCYMRIISSAPMGTELFVRVSTNYEQLATICKQREGHKLKEDYANFFAFIKQLPYADDFILCELKSRKK